MYCCTAIRLCCTAIRLCCTAIRLCCTAIRLCCTVVLQLGCVVLQLGCFVLQLGCVVLQLGCVVLCCTAIGLCCTAIRDVKQPTTTIEGVLQRFDCGTIEDSAETYALLFDWVSTMQHSLVGLVVRRPLESGRSRVRIPLATGFFRGRVIPVT